MKIKLLVAQAHPTEDRSEGTVIDVSEDEAGRMIAARFALPFTAATAKEKAVKAKPKETRAQG